MFLTPIAADRPIRIVDTLIGYTLSNPCSQTWLVASTPAARWHFSTLTESTPLDQYQKNWYRWLHRRLLRLCQIWCKSVHGGLLGNWVKYNQIFIYLCIYTFFGNSLAGQTRRGIFTLDGPVDADLRKFVSFGVSLILVLVIEVKSPKAQFWVVNRRFQAKLAKSGKLHIIATTAPISTKYCTTIETTKWSSWVVPIRAQQIQDGGRPPFWKIR